MMLNYEKALLLYNGNAGKRNMEQKLAQTVPLLSQAIKELILIQTETLEEVKQICEAHTNDIDLLIILGGDGTVHEIINSIAPLKNRPVIAILPGGTSNDFSRMLRIPQNLRAAAEAIVHGEIINIDIGKSDERYFLNFWGIGLITDTSLNINESEKNNFGALSYIMGTIRTVNQAESFAYEIVSNTDKYVGEAVLIVVLNGVYIGTREVPIPTISPNDGKLDILIVKNSNLTSFRELLSMGNPDTNVNELEELTHFQTESLTISTPEKKDIDMDGEVQVTTPATISVLPNHVKMIRYNNN